MPGPFGAGDRPSRVRKANQLPSSRNKGGVECDCPMAAAVQAARAGRFRLAARYARLAARVVGRRVTVAAR